MPQLPKPHVRARILEGAIHTFAKHGYQAATMRQIAQTAGVSLGNVYRYFDGKETLFAQALPDDFVDAFETLIRRRVRALRGVSDVAALAPDADFHLVSEELLRFCIEHRLRVIVLLSRSEGSVREGYEDLVVKQLVALALDHARAVGGVADLDGPARLALDQIYRNFVTAMVRALWAFEHEEDLRTCLRWFERYHLSGLKAFLQGGSS